MKRRRMFLVAALAALSITACGNGDGIVINGTTAAEAGNEGGESDGTVSQETGTGTKIEIITDDSSPAEETAPQPAESQSQAPVSQPETTAYVPETAAAAATAAAPTQAVSTAVLETTAAKTYKVTDTKKTMYATASVRVRSGYSTSSGVLAGLEKGEKVEVTGESENGWMRVNYKGNVGYVSKSYLTETVPETSAVTSSAGQSSGGTGASQGTGAGTANTQGGGSGTGSTQGTASGSGSTPGGSSGTGTTAGPSADSGGNSSTGGKTGPGAGTNSGNSVTAGSTTGPGGSSGSASSPGTSSGGSPSAPGSTSPGSTSSGGSTSGGNSVTGSVTSLNPSGVTIQTSDGASYQFVWGDNTPDLEPGEKIQIFYETTGSGERRVTNYSK